MRHLDYPPIWLAAFAGLAVLQARWLPVGGGGDWTRLAGAGLVVAGLGLMGLAGLAFLRHRTTIIPHRQPDALITDGVFTVSRNPIYLGDVLVLAGIVLWLGAWPSLVLVPLLGWMLERRFIRPEEARLRAAFGGEFARYAARTRRWI